MALGEISDHASRGELHPDESPTSGGANHIGAIEDHANIAAEPPAKVLKQLDAAFALTCQIQLGPAELGHVVAIDDDNHPRSAQQMRGARLRVPEHAPRERDRLSFDRGGANALRLDTL